MATVAEDAHSGAGVILPCGPADDHSVLAIINAAAEAYRGVIPPDRWHDPYMRAEELASEIADGVVFSGFSLADRLVGVMGVQRRINVDLIRHAYVNPAFQGRGVGSRLLGHLCAGADRPILVGTWRAAGWAIDFYRRHGFACVDGAATAPLLRTYWNVPDRQIETSIVLALPPLVGGGAYDLLAEATVTSGR